MSIIPTVLTLVAAGGCGGFLWLLCVSLPANMTEYGFSEKELTIW